MIVNQSNDGFDDAIKGFHNTPYEQHTPVDSGPYGIPVHSIPVKPGLTKRGKVAIAIGTTILATGGLVFWQHNNTEQAASEAKQQELQLEKARLDLEMVKEINKASARTSKTRESADAERQKQIAACVNTDKGLVGKQMGVNYSSVLKDCQAQFPPATDGSDMQTAASSTDTNGGGSVNTGLLIAGGVLAGGVVLVTRRRPTVSNAQ